MLSYDALYNFVHAEYFIQEDVLEFLGTIQEKGEGVRFHFCARG